MTVMTAKPVYRKKANNRLKYVSNLSSLKICIDLSYILLRKLPYKNRIVSLFIYFNYHDQSLYNYTPNTCLRSMKHQKIYRFRH